MPQTNLSAIFRRSARTIAKTALIAIAAAGFLLTLSGRSKQHPLLPAKQQVALFALTVTSVQNRLKLKYRNLFCLTQFLKLLSKFPTILACNKLSATAAKAA